MQFIFQRIIQNGYQWTRPSPGRLGPYGEGKYVQNNGFGHEDWNFNTSLTIDGNIYGYCYYRPSEVKIKDKFNIAFGVYTNAQWYIIGFYFNSVFEINPETAERIIKQKSSDLLLLGNSLGSKWQNLSNASVRRKMKDEAQYLNWKVKATDAIRFPQPIQIPKKLFQPKNYRITKPIIINKRLFEKLYKLSKSGINLEDYSDEHDFPEGKERERMHRDRERSSTVTAIAKKNFVMKNGKLFCQICNFDFEKKYGEIGSAFIEAHHTIPVSKLTKNSKTNPKDIAMVCSNCHRMLHRRRPWLDMKQLKSLLKQNEE